MSSQDRAVPTRAVAAWVVYDLANTIFSMGVISLFFPHFVERSVGETRVDRVFGLIQAVSYGIIFVVSPLLGAMTDRAGRRMPFLVWSTVICVVATAAARRSGSFTFSAVLFIIANAAYQAGLQFYDALLPEVTTEQNRGKISGIGVGIGYLGSFVAVGARLCVRRGVLHAPLAVQSAVPGHRVFVRRPVSALFSHRARTSACLARAGLQLVGHPKLDCGDIATLRSSQRYPGLARFLIGRVFYTDAINTVIGVHGALYDARFGRRRTDVRGSRELNASS